MKPRTKIVAVLVVLSGVAPMIYNPLYARGAQHDAPAPTVADPKPDAAQTEIQEALPKGKKLILKDGTFQLAREYSVEGDRVRYWSVERSQWEEIPSQLVDWNATHSAEAQQAASDAELKAKIRASELAERTAGIDVDGSLEIKPDLFLPDGVGFYCLDSNKQIREMKQSAAGAHLSKSREAERILTGVPFIPTKQTLEIPGTRSALRFTAAEPEFYMRPADDRDPRFRLVHAHVIDGHRTVDTLTVHMSGKETHNADDIAFQTWTPARGIFRYTVEQPLEPGEYAFIEMTDEGVSGYVWDFGIDLSGKKNTK